MVPELRVRLLCDNRPMTPAMTDPPPHPFGASLRSLWGLDPAVAFLNHGSFGATPRTVLAAQDDWRARVERQPVRFMKIGRAHV